jgi:hypothetical protein
MEEYHNRDWLPGLDAHDGNLPKIGVQVPVDHTLILGGVGQSTSGADVVDIVASAPQHLRPWLPLRVTAHEVDHMMINGDWKISRDERGSVNKEWWTERSSPTE